MERKTDVLNLCISPVEIVEQLDPGRRAMHFSKYIFYKEFFLALPIKVFVDPGHKDETHEVKVIE